jgi:hypothetical protein
VVDAVVAFDPLIHGGVVSSGRYVFIRRSDDPAARNHFFYPVGRPARYPTNSKEGCEELIGYIQHTVDKAAVEIDVGADLFE